MILFPAIDIRNGRCVRLTQGDYQQETVYGEPLDMANKWSHVGAEWLHLIDLDGALTGGNQNFKAIKSIVTSLPIPVQVGGGIRSLEIIEKYISIGVKRVILGSAALKNSDFLHKTVKDYSEQIAVSIDAKNGLVATDGWTKTSNERAVDFAKRLEEVGVSTIIYTDIAKDGMLSGPNFGEIETMMKETSLNVIASGGVTSHGDIVRLKNQDVYGAIIGKALYTGELDLERALKEVKVC